MNILGLSLLFISFSSMAHETFITRINSISWGQQEEESHIVKFQNARVGLVARTSKTLPLDRGALVEVVLNSENELVSMTKVEDNQAVISINTPFVTDVAYEPTEVKGYGEAGRIMDRFRGNSLQGSQCYNRAHVWAFEEFKRSGLKSMKAFLFFSDEYIRRHNHRWWFHVAPMVFYKTLGMEIEKVLDQTFANRPLSIDGWSDRFLKNSTVCKMIERYSEYSRPTSEEDCYVLKASMYFWQPKDLELFENEGLEKINFFDWEVLYAFQDAFNIVPKLD